MSKPRIRLPHLTVTPPAVAVAPVPPTPVPVTVPAAPVQSAAPKAVDSAYLCAGLESLTPEGWPAAGLVKYPASTTSDGEALPERFKVFVFASRRHYDQKMVERADGYVVVKDTSRLTVISEKEVRLCWTHKAAFERLFKVIGR